MGRVGLEESVCVVSVGCIGWRDYGVVGEVGVRVDREVCVLF